MKLGFVFTNFNNSAYTLAAVRSLAESPNWLDCKVVVVDNRSELEDRERLATLKVTHPAVDVLFNSSNIGYFPGLNLGIDRLFDLEPAAQVVVVGNNDLVFPQDFVAIVQSSSDLFEKYPVISPDLLTLDGVHQNPHVARDVSRIRELVYDCYFASYPLARLIRWGAKVTKRFAERTDHHAFREAQGVYQGYGACYLLGPLFFREFRRLWAPTFLMGEEFFLSRQLAAKGYQVRYEPRFLVHHHDHATMEKVPSRKFWEISRDAHRVYRRYVRPLSRNMHVMADPADLP